MLYRAKCEESDRPRFDPRDRGEGENDLGKIKGSRGYTKVLRRLEKKGHSI